MSQRRIMMACLPAVVSIAALSGCGDGVQTGRVQGTVTFNGEPVPNLMVEFAPVENVGWKLPPGMGQTNAEGVYSLVRPGPGGRAGASVGTHTVRVLSDEGSELKVIGGRKVAGTVSQREVKPGSNTIDIELTSP